MAIKKKVALYISSPEEANTLRERCAPVKPMLEIGLMKTFGSEPAADSFKKIHALMTSKDADLDWVIFHLPSVSKMIGSAVFLNELKKLIRAKAVEKTQTYIIDSGASMNSDGRAAFERFRVHIVDDESYIGDVFAKILDVNQLDIAEAAKEDPLFEGLVDEGNRLPGMRKDTPAKLNKSEADPFDDFDAALATEDEDPFAKSVNEKKAKTPDPFAAFNITAAEMATDPFAGNSHAGAGNPFAELDFDGPAPDPFAPAGPGAPIMADRTDPFSSLENPFGSTDPNDPFAAWNASSTISRANGIQAAPPQSDPFAALRAQSAAAAPGGYDDFDDPFADADFGNSEFVDQRRAPQPARPAARPARNNEPLFDDRGGYGDEFDDDLVDYDEYDDFGPAPSGGMKLMTVEQLLENYGDNLGDNEYLKMKSMMEPKWDYIMEQEDKIGAAAGGFKLQIGKKGALKGISQVNSDDLANSVYIKEVEAEKGYYSPPNECKVISVWSPKGGPGKSLPWLTSVLYYDEQEKQLKSGQLKDIEVGDKVFNLNGELVTVLEVHDQPEKLRSYEITLSDGRTIRCSSDHIWSVLHRGDNKAKDRFVQKTLSELLEQPLMKNAQNGHGEYRWKIPTASAVDFPEQDLPIPPYVLGILIGDGYLASSSYQIYVSSGDQEIIDELEKELDYVYRIDKCRPHDDKDYSWVFHIRDKENFTGKKLHEKLDDLDLRHTTMEKFIPEIYKMSSAKQRKELLQGLMDSDGTAHTGRFEFTTINTRLRDDVIWLLRSLGYVCSYCDDYRPEKHPSSDGHCWNVTIRSNDDSIFRLKRKKAAFQGYKSKQTKVDPLPMSAEPVLYDCGNNEVELPIDPYLYGMIAVRSQQRHSSVKIRCASDYIVRNVIECLPDGTILRKAPGAQEDCYCLIRSDGKRTSDCVNDSLELLGEGYRSPSSTGLNELYLHASPAQRKRMLQGILDARGIWTRTGHPAYTPLCDAMLANFKELVSGLGYKYHEVASGRKKNLTTIALDTSDLMIFGDDIKREQFHNWLMTTGRIDGRSQTEHDHGYVSIVDIRDTGEYEDMRCLYVDDPAHMFLVGDFIPTHNTTVSVMLATQLNWYFNPELMQNLTTSYTARILLLSLNEFDDIPTHGIGYDEYLSDENDNDGKNVVELIRRIEETNGDPSWDDISYCFVATRANKVFYLPSLTQREQITGNIVVSAQDYKKVIDVCSKFFSFIIMDSPDLFYHEKADIMNFAFSVSDVICFVIEPDTHSTTHLYHFFDGLRGDTNKFPLDSNKCICVVNKYVTKGNVYMPIEPIGQLKFEKIATSMSKYFARFVAIPFTQPRSYGNVLDGTDPKVKYAAAELADDVLELIDYNDEVEEKKKQQRQRRR